MKRFACIIFLTILTTPLLGQKQLTAGLASEKIQHGFYSDSSRFYFKIGSIDSLTFNQFILRADSISDPYYPIYGSGWKKKNAKFMADNDERWRAGDFITRENKELPQRRFLFAWTQRDETVIFYWHGGYGTHLHIALIDSNTALITGFVTVKNSDIIHKLDRDHKLQEIRLQKIQQLVTANEVSYLNGKQVHDDDDAF